MKADMDKEEKQAFSLILNAVYAVVPTPDYLQAENDATMADRRDREAWGESNGLLPDLRSKRDSMLEEALDLARSMVSLKREMQWLRDGQPVPDGLIEELGFTLNTGSK